VADSLTKRIVAQRQLVTAIRLLFDNADLVPVYSLAANAWEIIDTLATLANVNSISSQARENVPLGKDLKLDFVNSPYRNFFKHADRDPGATVLPLKEAYVDSVIFLGVEDYLRLFGKSPPEFQVFQLWYLALHEEKLAHEHFDRIIPLIASEFPNIRSLAREDQLTMARATLHSAWKDNDLLEDPRTEV
jgi:hypothetical protein